MVKWNVSKLEHTILEEIINIGNIKRNKRITFKDKVLLEKVIDKK